MVDTYGGIVGQDRSLEDETRDLRWYGWNPLYHRRIFTTYEELVNAINAENGRLEFFSGLPVPRNRHLTNLKQDQKFPYNCNLDGTGIHVFHQNVTLEATGAVDLRRAILENTRWEYILNDTRRLCDHPTVFMTPGAQVSGMNATTQTLVDRVNSSHGFNHPRVYYRFGGPDMKQIPQVTRESNHIGYLWFNAQLLAFLQALVTAEELIKDMGMISIMATVYTWDYEPIT